MELLGSPQTPAADDADSSAAARCNTTNYPYPDNDPEFFAIPNNDGPLQTLPLEVDFGTRADDRVLARWLGARPERHDESLAGDRAPTGLSLTMYDVKYPSTMVKSITVNGLGKITLQ